MRVGGQTTCVNCRRVEEAFIEERRGLLWARKETTGHVDEEKTALFGGDLTRNSRCVEDVPKEMATSRKQHETSHVLQQLTGIVEVQGVGGVVLVICLPFQCRIRTSCRVGATSQSFA